MPGDNTDSYTFRFCSLATSRSVGWCLCADVVFDTGLKDCSRRKSSWWFSCVLYPWSRSNEMCLMLGLIPTYNGPSDTFCWFSAEHVVIGSTTRTTQMSRGMFKNNNLVQSYRAPQDSLPALRVCICVCVCVCVWVWVMEEVDVTSFLWLRQTPGAAFEHENDSACSQRASLLSFMNIPYVFFFCCFFCWTWK